MWGKVKRRGFSIVFDEIRRKNKGAKIVYVNDNAAQVIAAKKAGANSSYENI